jgi:hypothetical protein
MCVQLNNSEVDMLIDTGSSINVIDEKTFNNLKCDAKRSKANTKVYTYGSDNTLQLMGKFYATFESMHYPVIPLNLTVFITQFRGLT